MVRLNTVQFDEIVFPCIDFQVTEASVLFVDNPVGTGFSYVDNDDAYAKDIDTITSDLLAFMIQFLERHPVFKVGEQGSVQLTLWP